eukprot:CAMPEP_0119259794 /NCGR_PEP_ID=MMETSP1329-20130426/466_1 /TAXON_ID=114041 /ORGANISM="Genus nov. species nov., Strain RCC1024" /LENGTH=95 /DNA_ID=CAMNT_0007259195 /DNA_START=73 /DNA_END=360 /DNA_ORIENTATION=+
MARSLFAALCLSAAAAFAPIARTALRATTSAAMVPEAAQALDVVSQLPTQLVSLEVTTEAFLAVILGTFVPCVFLITLYIQSEAALLGERVGELE